MNGVWSRYVLPGARDEFFESRLERAFSGRFWRGCGVPLRKIGQHLAREPARVVVKEVAAFLSVEWVAHLWRPQIVLIVRHPAAYAASVRNLRQEAEEIERFRLLRDNPVLQERFLGNLDPKLAPIREPLEASVASWAIRNVVVFETRKRYPEWRVVGYEAVAEDPLGQFKRLYEDLGLLWDASAREAIQRRSTTESAGQFATSRVSKKHIDAWRSRLSDDEILRIRKVLEIFELPIYSSTDDWP